MHQSFASTAALRPLPGILDVRSPSVLSARRSRRFHGRVTPAQQRQAATDRLFLAVVPPPDVAARIADLARRLRVGHELNGKPLETDHFHVTLCPVVEGIGLPSGIVDQVTERAAAVPMPAFKVAFDRVMSFRNGAFVLCGDESVIGVEVLQQRLSDALDFRPERARHYKPHVTLLRDSHIVPEHDIEPIEWTVDEITLVHSLLGKTTHRHLARLPLG